MTAEPGEATANAAMTERMFQMSRTGMYRVNMRAAQIWFGAFLVVTGLLTPIAFSTVEARAAAQNATTSWSDGEPWKARGFKEADYPTGTPLPQVTVTLSPKSPNRTVVLEWHKGGGKWVLDDTQKARKGMAKLSFNPMCQITDGTIVWCDQRYNYRVRVLPTSKQKGFPLRQFLVQFKSIAGAAAPAATAPATTTPAPAIIPVTPLPSSPGTKFLGCRFGGKQLWGKIFVVDSSWQADAKIIQVSSAWQSDLKVQQVANSWEASSCGKWYFVTNSWEADLKVYFVDSSWQADVKVATVAYSPGLN